MVGSDNCHNNNDIDEGHTYKDDYYGCMAMVNIILSFVKLILMRMRMTMMMIDDDDDDDLGMWASRTGVRVNE